MVAHHCVICRSVSRETSLRRLAQRLILRMPARRMSSAAKATAVVGRGDRSLRAPSAAAQRDAIQLGRALLPHSRRSAFLPHQRTSPSRRATFCGKTGRSRARHGSPWRGTRCGNGGFRRDGTRLFEPVRHRPTRPCTRELGCARNAEPSMRPQRDAPRSRRTVGHPVAACSHAHFEPSTYVSTSPARSAPCGARVREPQQSRQRRAASGFPASSRWHRADQTGPCPS